MQIKAEWDPLNHVLMHLPGNEITYAMFAPTAFLFERPFNYTKAVNEHHNLQQILRDNGIKVDILSELVEKTAETNHEFRKNLENVVKSRIHFYGTVESLENAQRYLDNNIDYIDSRSLFEALIMELSIDLKKYVAGIEYPTIYSNLPLANLYFMRDQQAVSNGVIIGKMRMQQRRKETEITSFIFKNIFRENVKEIKNGYFEGGDFIPAGNFALIGIGNRTDYTGALEVMNSGALNFDEIAVIRNPTYDFTNINNIMINMHLDTYFNIPSSGIAITSEVLIKNAHADIYVRNDGHYTKEYETNLHDYIKGKGYNIINLGISEQLSYSSNFLTLKDKKIIAIDSKKVIKKLLKENVFDDITKQAILKDIEKKDRVFPDNKEILDYGIDVIKIDLSELTGGYGGAHCMTSALNRN